MVSLTTVVSFAVLSWHIEFQAFAILIFYVIHGTSFATVAWMDILKAFFGA